MKMQEIAKLARVSVTTVSKVINGKDQDISQETRERVLRIVQEEQYVPYAKSRSAEEQKHPLIGLILREEQREGTAIAHFAEQAARKRGYSLILRHYKTEEELEESILELAQSRASGLLVDAESWKPYRRLEEATVYFSSTKSFDRQQRVSFYYRLSEAARLAVQRLRREGHEKIACLNLRARHSVQEGYRAAMLEEHLLPRPLWMFEGESLADMDRYGIQQCLRADVTAVVCGSWEIAFCLYRALEKIGIGVPQNISIISIGSSSTLSLLGSSMHAVELPVEELCQSAVEHLADIIEQGKDVHTTRKFSPKLVEGKSVAPPPRAKTGGKLAVVGSMNMDITFKLAYEQVNKAPQLVERVFESPGGKAANQAVGISRLGAQASVIGCLGDDIEGRQIYSNLVENNVQVQGLRFDSALGTGRAHINLSRGGESTIVVYQGANQHLDVSHINRYSYLLQEANFCVITSEIPMEVVQHTAMLCRKNGVTVLFKPMATDKLTDELLENITYFIPNEDEVDAILPGEATLEEKAAQFLEKGVENVIVTLGARGCYLKNAEHSLYLAGSGFQAVDTTGGADSFISALAVALNEGKELIYALLFAIYASGITVTRYGVQHILPERQDVDVYEDEMNKRYREIMERGD